MMLSLMDVFTPTSQCNGKAIVDSINLLGSHTSHWVGVNHITITL